MKIKNWFKSISKLDNELTSMKDKEVTATLPCPANQHNTDCNLVEQLKNKQKELKEILNSGGQYIRFIPTYFNESYYGIKIDVDINDECLDDIEYLKEKFISAIDLKFKIDTLRTEIAELKQKLGIE